MGNMNTGGLRDGIKGGTRTRSHTRSKSISRKRSRSKYGGQKVLNADNTAASHYVTQTVAKYGNPPPIGFKGGKHTRSKSRKRQKYGGELQPLTPQNLSNDPNHIWLGGSRPTRSKSRKRPKSRSKSRSRNGGYLFGNAIPG